MRSSAAVEEVTAKFIRDQWLFLVPATFDILVPHELMHIFVGNPMFVSLVAPESCPPIQGRRFLGKVCHGARGQCERARWERS